MRVVFVFNIIATLNDVSLLSFYPHNHTHTAHTNRTSYSHTHQPHTILTRTTLHTREHTRPQGYAYTYKSKHLRFMFLYNKVSHIYTLSLTHTHSHTYIHIDINTYITHTPSYIGVCEHVGECVRVCILISLCVNM